MSERRKVELGPIGPDIDLDKEVIYAADGRRLTNKLAAEIAERALAKHPGRPSVSTEQVRTPSLTVRVPTRLRQSLERIAKTQGRRLADVSRDALAESAERHES
jgi:hypothetical protein